MYRTLFLALCFICFSAEGKIPEKVVICGVCKNVDQRIPHTIKIIEKIGSLFQDYRVVVYENNSHDSTPHIVKNWMRKNPKVFTKSEHLSKTFLDSIIINLKENNQYYHPEEIARARNIVLDIAMSDSYKDFPYIIWIDMDFKIPPSYKGFAEVFKSNHEWDAVLAYGIDPPGTYWDWYAFRDSVYPIGSELLGNYWWYMPRQFKLTKNDDWYPVYSAFGGCGIYKKSSISGCRYSAIVTKDLETLSKQLIDKGIQKKHPLILKYLKDQKMITNLIEIKTPQPNLAKHKDPNTGFILYENKSPLVWKMSSFVYQYPSVCEHVTFHASMIIQGHDKIFINPRLLFTYGG